MAQRLVTTVWDEGAQTINYMWYTGKGEKPIPIMGKDGKPLVLDLTRVPAEMRLWDALHGAQQKTCDGFSDAEKVSNGDLAKKKAFIVSTIEQAIANQYAGEWGTRGEGGPREEPLLYEALVRIDPKKFPTPAAAREWVKAQPENVQGGLKKTPRVLDAINAIKAARVKGDANVAAAEAALGL